MKNFILVVFCFFTASSLPAQENPECATPQESKCCAEQDLPSCCAEAVCCSAARPDGIGPIGMMGDHYHHRGGLMLSYRLMNMRMKGNQQGSDDIDNMKIFEDYQMAPDEMTMNMHMVGAMYGLTDRITLMAMGNYLESDMSMLMVDGEVANHGGKGIGDVKLSAIIGLWESGSQSILANIGLSLPVGDIDLDEMHQHGHHEIMMNLPNPMQLGSGTNDILLSATYLNQWTNFSFGFQPKSVVRTGENHNEYTLGNQYQINSWLAYKVNDWLSASLRLTGDKIEKISGSDDEMMADMAPTSNSINSGGDYLNAYAGLNILIPDGPFSGLNFGLEYGQPLYQNVNWIQMQQRSFLTAGLRYSLF